MHNRILITLIAAAAAVTAYSQAPVGTPAAEAFLLRGSAMMNDNNFVGAENQFATAVKAGLTGSLKEWETYSDAIAALRSGDPCAQQKISAFINNYPASPLRWLARKAVADCFYDKGMFREALAVYREIPSDVMESASTNAMLYHRGFCEITESSLESAERDFTPLLADRTYTNDARFFLGYIAYAKKDYAGALAKFKEVVPQGTGPTRMTDFYLSQIYYNDSKYSSAYSAAKQALEIPDIPQEFIAEAERVAGESAYSLDKPSEAVAHLRKYRSLTSAPLPSALYILGVSEYRDSEWQNAVVTLTPVAAEDNAIGQSANLYIGQASAKLGNYSAAMMAFDNAYRMNFDPQIQETALYNYAVAKSEGGKIPFGSSVSTFETFLKQYPNSRYAPEVSEYIVTGYMTENNYTAALRSIEAIKNPSESILRAKQQVLYTLGVKELASGDNIGALNRFRQAKAMGNINQDVSRELDLWIAEALYKGKSYNAASDSYRAYISRNPNGRNIAAAYYGLGYSLFGEKDFTGAYAAFDSFLSKGGKASATMRADALNRMADTRYYGSEFDRAAALYDRAYSTNPATGDYAVFQKAMMKGLRRQYPEKIAGMKSMMESFPTSALVPQALLEIGEAYNESGETAKVIETYTTLSGKYPETAQGRQGQLRLAITYLSAGKQADAANTYKNLIRKYPTSEEAKTAAEDLKRMSADAGTLPEFVAFMNSVPNAPQINPSEIDRLTFEAAEKTYLAKKDIAPMRGYLSAYPSGSNKASALFYSAEAYQAEGKHTAALRDVSTLLDSYPHFQMADDAMLLKAEAESSLDMLADALVTYETLESKASSPLALNKARLGLMKTARDLGEGEKALAAADRLLASSALESGEREEILFSRGVALEMTGRNDDAVAQWEQLSSNTDNLYGTKAVFYLANHYFSNGDLNNARKYAEALVDADTPHNYWLARTFILLSDINRQEGNTFEADEYLKSLRDNYPGSEADIFTMIEQRLQ